MKKKEYYTLTDLKRKERTMTKASWLWSEVNFEKLGRFLDTLADEAEDGTFFYKQGLSIENPEQLRSIESELGNIFEAVERLANATSKAWEQFDYGLDDRD